MADACRLASHITRPRAKVSLAGDAFPPRRISGASHSGLVGPPAVGGALAGCSATKILLRLKSASCTRGRWACK